MQVKTICSLMLGAAVMVASLTANAQGTPEAAPTGEPAGTTSAAATAGMPNSKMRVGLNLVPMPFGTLKANVGGADFSADTAFAFGVAAFFDYSITPNIFIGVGPQYILNVKGKDADGSAAKELDLQLRLGGGAPVAEKIQIYGYLSPGYGIIMPPEGDSAKGLMLGIHAGGMMDVSPTVFVAAELGYQLGFQKVNSTDLKSNFFQIGLGGGLRL
jgi:hypothetical protein